MFTNTPVGSRRSRATRRAPSIPPIIPSVPPYYIPASASASASLTSFSRGVSSGLVGQDLDQTESEEDELSSQKSTPMEETTNRRRTRQSMTSDYRRSPSISGSENDGSLASPARSTRSATKGRHSTTMVPLMDHSENRVNTKSSRRTLRRSIGSVASDLSEMDSIASGTSIRKSSRRKSTRSSTKTLDLDNIENEEELTPRPLQREEQNQLYTFSDEDKEFATIGMNDSIQADAPMNDYSAEYPDSNDLPALIRQFYEGIAMIGTIAIFALSRRAVRNTIYFLVLIGISCYLFRSIDLHNVYMGTDKFKNIQIPVFNVPSKIPETNDEVISRLVELEGKLGQVIDASHEFQTEYYKFVQQEDTRLEEVRKQVLSAVSDQANSMSNVYKKLQDDAARSLQGTQESLSALSLAFRSFQAHQDSFDQSLNTISKTLESIESASQIRNSEVDGKLSELFVLLTDSNKAIEVVKGEYSLLNGRITDQDDRLGNSILALEARVDDILSRMTDIAQRTALDAIEKLLPERLPVRFDEMSPGKLVIAPEFWKYLKTAFPDRSEMDNIDSSIKSLRDLFYRRAQKSDEKEDDSRASLTWDEFLARNDESLKRYVDAHVNGLWKGLDDQQTFVSKSFFMEILKNEIDAVRDELVDKLKNSELNFKALVVENENRLSKLSSFSHSAKQHISGSSTLNLTQSAVDNLIDQALERYQNGLTRRIDYADINSGARTLIDLTSPSFDPFSSLNALHRTLLEITGSKGSKKVHSAAEALDPESGSGNCWPFLGQEGCLGIRLGEWIYIDEIGVNHIPRALSRLPTTAPKEFEFWVEINDPAERHELKTLVDDIYNERLSIEINKKDGSTSERGKMLGVKSANDIMGKRQAENFIRVGMFTYDLYGPFHFQTFKFPRQISQQLKKIPVKNVVFRFTQNWGAEDYTCIYKTIVHGSPLNASPDSDDTKLSGSYQWFGDDDSDKGLGEDTPI
ncbi:hypothetical protein V1511DRAFT_489731 [Dipodascopsis uninucleata]